MAPCGGTPYARAFHFAAHDTCIESALLKNLLGRIRGSNVQRLTVPI
jgi:hypothetical protein